MPHAIRLPEQQMRAGRVGAHLRAAEPLDRLTVAVLGDPALAHQRARTRLQPPGLVSAARVGGAVNSLKGVSARRLRSEFTGRVNRASMRGHFWSPSYFAASYGDAPLSTIRQHIDQKQRPPGDRAGLKPHP